MITLELVALGFIAGFTIFLGLPVAVMHKVSARVKGFLNAITIGVIIYILVEVLSEADRRTESALAPNALNAVPDVAAFIVGISLGIFGLVGYERYFIRIKRRRANGINSAENSKSFGIGEAEAQDPASMASQRILPPKGFSAEEAKEIALSIAIGIGVHNFTEGLAIGQTYSAAALSLSYFLVIGFAIHNTTEGFGIAAPLAGGRPRTSYLALLGLIGGGPTLIGTMVGGVWPASTLTLIFILAVAGGALIYVISGMFYVARRQTSNELFMLGLIIGFLIAYGTDLYITAMGA